MIASSEETIKAKSPNSTAYCQKRVHSFSLINYIQSLHMGKRDFFFLYTAKIKIKKQKKKQKQQKIVKTKNNDQQKNKAIHKCLLSRTPEMKKYNGKQKKSILIQKMSTKERLDEFHLREEQDGA